MKGKKKILLILGIVIVVAIIGIAMVKSKSQTNESGKESIYVNTASVEMADLSSTITTKGTVEAKESAKVYSDLSGLVKEVLISKGDVVVKDQILVEMDTEALDQKIRDAKVQWEIAQINYENALNGSSVDAAVRSAKTAYDNAGKNYEDSKSMFESGAISQKDLDLSKQNYDMAYDTYMEAVNSKSTKNGSTKILGLTAENAKNAYDDLLILKEKASIKAPMAGTVTQLDVKKYDMTTLGVPIAVIETVDQLEISTYIGEYDINKIKIGMPVTITGYGVGDNEYTGKVVFVGSSAEVRQAGQSTEKSVLVKVDFDDQTDFKPNFTADLEIVFATANETTVVPYEALLNVDKALYVLKVVEDKVQRVEVEMGVHGELSVEVKSAEISADDRVILNPSVDIEDGVTVIELGEGTK